LFSYYVINKPYGVVSQFNPPAGKTGLGTLFNFPKDVYPVGRLDEDSEGLLILTNDKKLTNDLLNPELKHERTYWVQVDGEITTEACRKLENGVEIKLKDKTHNTLPAKAKKICPSVEERNPPIRYRKEIPTSWIELTLTEGKNRQVRKMTAKVGFPTIRLIRVKIGKLQLSNFKAGAVNQIQLKNIL
jgi:23S rRNA pseudouridine2457 synthase